MNVLLRLCRWLCLIQSCQSRSRLRRSGAWQWLTVLRWLIDQCQCSLSIYCGHACCQLSEKFFYLRVVSTDGIYIVAWYIAPICSLRAQCGYRVGIGECIGPVVAQWASIRLIELHGAEQNAALFRRHSEFKFASYHTHRVSQRHLCLFSEGFIFHIVIRILRAPIQDGYPQ